MATLSQEQLNILRDRGLSDSQIKQISVKKGFDMPGVSGLPGVGLGALKGGLGISVGLAGGIQNIGQRALAAVTPKTLEEVQATTGLKSLDTETEEGQFVRESLRPKGQAEQIGSAVVDVASFFIPTAKGLQVGGRVLEKTGEKITGLGIGINAEQAPLVQAYRAKHTVPQRVAAALQGKRFADKPITNAETVLRQNLFGTESMVGVGAKRASGNLWNQLIKPALKESKTSVKMDDLFTEITAQINRIPDPSRKRELEIALRAFKEDHSKIGSVNFEKLQELKEGWAKFLPDKVYRGKPIASSFREIQNIAASLARNKIYKELGPEIRAAYIDYGNLKNLEALGQKALTGAKFKGGAGTFVSGLYDMAMTPISTSAGLTLYKAGRGLEFVGNTGLNTVRQIFGL